MKALAQPRIDKLQKKFNLLGVSEEIKEVVRTIEQVGPTDITVLIQGESGTGKELVSRALHMMSSRRDKQMLIVNGGAIPEGLIESELFGHTRGSFTGAISDRKGYFEEADGGTLFLDEIGEMPTQTQVKLLRVLEQGEYQRVGSAAARKVDVRIIAATNRDLARAVEQGEFRRDLFYRLRAITIKVPAIRERKEDIPILAQLFATEYAESLGIEFGGYSDDSLELMQQYEWKGNVRELKNFVQSLIVLEKGRVITGKILGKHLQSQGVRDDFPNLNLPVPIEMDIDKAEREMILRTLFLLRREVAELKGLLFNRMMLPSGIGGGEPDGFSKAIEESPIIVDNREVGEISMDEMEKELIKRTLERHHGNRRKSSEALGISERTLYRKLNDYGL